ncbi:hypothetical protein FOMPIDRAFT_86256 [Fomitopsis schrenkii]|uniref:Sec23/Sec24 beta-sandwich domain-containing protein n=1 Tax=Fomitopsis schrenkii TaxID=2126942 RepID=S8DK69_FOMSC|nr:hypothetical protein FOMPIDRAFT_86256 [Fomitopsis schrenkii]
MRVRASKNLRMSSFHGNFFVRSTDLLAMPAVPQDQSYAIEVTIEDTITSPFVVFQTAVLHTTCYGERRIRVVTLALPVTSNLSEVFASADQVAIATLLVNKAVERSITHKLEDARDALFSKMVEMLQAQQTPRKAHRIARTSTPAVRFLLPCPPFTPVLIKTDLALCVTTRGGLAWNQVRAGQANGYCAHLPAGLASSEARPMRKQRDLPDSGCDRLFKLLGREEGGEGAGPLRTHLSPIATVPAVWLSRKSLYKHHNMVTVSGPSTARHPSPFRRANKISLRALPPAPSKGLS